MFRPDRQVIVSLVTALALCVAFSAAAQEPLVAIGKAELTDLAYSPDGRLLAAATVPYVELLDADTFETVTRLTPGGRLAEFSADGSRLAVCEGHGGPMRLWDTSTWRVVGQLPEISDEAALSPDGRLVASAGSEANSRDITSVWSVEDRRLVRELSGDPEPFLDSVFRGNASGGTRMGTSRPGVTQVVFHPDGRRLLTVSRRRTMALWDVQTGELLQHFQVGDTWVEDACLSVAGTLLVAGTFHYEILVWRIGEEEPFLRFDMSLPEDGSTYFLSDVEFAQDGRTGLVGGGQ